jgi:molecular chaperone HtpG
MTLAEVRERAGAVRYVAQVDPFRQIAQVAAAQDLCVVNGGYVYNAELLRKYSELHPQLGVSEIDPSQLARAFGELSPDERRRAEGFLGIADAALAEFRCAALIKRFDPPELPTLYTVDPEAAFQRSLEQSQEVSGGAWGGLLGDLSAAGPAVHAQLCFNWSNALVQSVIGQEDADLVRRCVQLLYVQALLLGHRPLSEREMRVLNEGLLGMIEWGLGKDTP